MAKKLTVGHIPYVNCEPFYAVPWPAGWQRKSAPPRGLAMLMEEGLIDAAPLSLVDVWRLGHLLEPLENFGIAVQDHCQSITLFSRRPLWEDTGIIAVTEETSTAVKLLQVLLEERYRIVPHFERRHAPQEGDESWLVIGDEALKHGPGGLPGFSYKTDLISQWWEWKSMPFVFARWVVRRDLSKKRKQAVKDWLSSSLSVGFKNFSSIAARRSEDVNVSEQELLLYLKSFHYQLGPEDEQAMEEFRHLLKKSESLASQKKLVSGLL